MRCCAHKAQLSLCRVDGFQPFTQRLVAIAYIVEGFLSSNEQDQDLVIARSPLPTSSPSPAASAPCSGSRSAPRPHVRTHLVGLAQLATAVCGEGRDLAQNLWQDGAATEVEVPPMVGEGTEPSPVPPHPPPSLLPLPPRLSHFPLPVVIF
ncbi:hypothetical protein NL676_016790 [Syzygium grande]|nr:hypothetical protein NL676_016790 [Syzygium grande]